MESLDYERFVKRYFRTVYAWCARQAEDEPSAALAAQRIVLDLYRAARTGDEPAARSTS